MCTPRETEERDDAVRRLEEIKNEMLELLGEARDLIRDNSRSMEYERADAYWLAHVEMALVKESRYLGGSMCTMDDTISELRGDRDRDDEDDEE